MNMEDRINAAINGKLNEAELEEDEERHGSVFGR